MKRYSRLFILALATILPFAPSAGALPVQSQSPEPIEYPGPDPQLSEISMEAPLVTPTPGVLEPSPDSDLTATPIEDNPAAPDPVPAIVIDDLDQEGLEGSGTCSLEEEMFEEAKSITGSEADADALLEEVVGPTGCSLCAGRCGEANTRGICRVAVDLPEGDQLASPRDLPVRELSYNANGFTGDSRQVGPFVVVIGSQANLDTSRIYRSDREGLQRVYGPELTATEGGLWQWINLPGNLLGDGMATERQEYIEQQAQQAVANINRMLAAAHQAGQTPTTNGLFVMESGHGYFDEERGSIFLYNDGSDNSHGISSQRLIDEMTYALLAELEDDHPLNLQLTKSRNICGNGWVYETSYAFEVAPGDSHSVRVPMDGMLWDLARTYAMCLDHFAGREVPNAWAFADGKVTWGEHLLGARYSHRYSRLEVPEVAFYCGPTDLQRAEPQ